MAHYDDGTPPPDVPPVDPAAQPADAPLEEVTVTGTRLPPPTGYEQAVAGTTPPVDQSSQSPDMPVTQLANALGLSKEDAVKILPELRDAYKTYIEKSTSTGRQIGNGMQRVGGWLGGGAAGAVNAQSAIAAGNKQLQDETIGLPLTMQKAGTQAIADTTAIQNANQTAYENQAKNVNTRINANIMAQSMDPNSDISQMTRATLLPEMKKVGMAIDDPKFQSASAAQLSQMVAGNAPLEKILNDTIEAHAKATTAGAAATTAATGAATERFNQNLVSNGSSAPTVSVPGQPAPQAGNNAPVQNNSVGGGGGSSTAPNATAPKRTYVLGSTGKPELAPEEITGAKAFQERGQKANDYAGNADSITTQLENALQQSIVTPSNQFGPMSIKAKATGYITGNTPQQDLNANLQKVGALNLADQAREIGSSAELRSATIDQKFIGSSPDATKDGKRVVVDKLLAQGELHLRNAEYARELSTYLRQHPEDPKGTNFTSNVGKMVFVVNLDGNTPASQRLALVPRDQAQALVKRGYITVGQAEQKNYQ